MSNEHGNHRICAKTYDTHALELEFLKGVKVMHWDGDYATEILAKNWPERFKSPTGLQPLDYS